ncbi:MAG: biopolymer transporter ExbD [Gammaproteobacteria bacterium]|nr:biopolymer transporter ExbD [Gammaproteobacteria bacterium]MCW8923508.1 biopolymer transporter ExbD [Gammaproteobacteria bacterium]
MKESRRARRMRRHHERGADKNAALNMVSLMDIFTILVFFLLVSAASSDILPTPKNIKLPRSTAEVMPRENLVIIVGENKILLQGKEMSDMKSVIDSNNKIIMPLYDGLIEMVKSKDAAEEKKDMVDQGVTILGDKEIPYAVLKKIMLTCSAAKFVNISFAVNRIPAKNG